MSSASVDFGSRALREEAKNDWRRLCVEIGERRAGTDAERHAANFVVEAFTAAGLSEVRIEAFPCTSLRGAKAELSELRGRRWRRVEAAPLVGAPGTPGARAMEGELVWLELPEEESRLRPGALRGRILAWFGPLPTSAAVHRRLLAAEPAAVIHVDERLPFSWAKNDGVYPYWARRYGMPVTLAVPYADAWRWRRDGVRRLRVRVALDQVAAASHNVMAERPGRDPSLPAVVLAAHHDTQCGNPGADDNASGVVCVLALARFLARRPMRRTLRFLSFGAEEQLSVGAAAYVAAERITPAKVGLIVNFDSVSSPLGHFVLSVAGASDLARHAAGRLAARGVAPQVVREVTPFADQFPFNRVGVPSLLLMRPNFSGGRWQHHSRHDTPENVSLDPVIRLLNAVAPLVCGYADGRRWPFPAGLPKAQREAARRLGEELFGI
ncbi:MAG: M28 family metallopeptidase [Opitutaceae bacterium]